LRSLELACPAHGDAVLLGETVEQRPARDAELRLKASRGVVEAGVNDLARAPARLKAGAGVLLEHHHLDPTLGQRSRDGKPDDAATNDDGLHISGHVLNCSLRGKLLKQHIKRGNPRKLSTAPVYRLEHRENTVHRERQASRSHAQARIG
jgi:hypothetical protein